MDLMQFNDESSRLVRHGSIEFLIPDVKMLDEFYRKRAISMEDITGGHDYLPETNLRVHRSPISIPAKRVIIKHVSSDVRSQYPSVASSQRSQMGTPKDDPHAQDVLLQPIDDFDPAHDRLHNSKFRHKHDDHQAYIEEFLDNRSSSIDAQIEDVYAALETQYTLDAALTRDSIQEIHIDHGSLVDTTSWTDYYTDEETSSPTSSNAFSEDAGTETGSVKTLCPQIVVVDEEIISLDDPGEEAKSHVLIRDNRWSAERPRTPSLDYARSAKGFAGRFSMLRPDRFFCVSDEATQYTFGLTYHPNGRIVNKSFIRDRHYQITSLDEAGIMHDAALSAAIRHAEITAARLEPLKQMQCPGERALRREIHRECALARLEGVSVGYFRYFAGHMTVEEYLAARICVCWSDCFCNKLCTRFGDMLCPCSENLELVD